MNLELVKKLEEKVKKASEAYYEGSPIISDEEFDKILSDLKKESPNSKVLRDVGFGYVPKTNKFKHKIPVGSLDKIKISNVLSISLEESEVSLKLDGLTLVVYYNELGKVSNIVTRGDGTYGVDVTRKLYRLIYPALHTFEGWSNLIVRGELLVPKVNFEGTSLIRRYSNPRAATTGILFNSDTTDLHNLEFVIFQVLENNKEVDLDKILPWVSISTTKIVPRIAGSCVNSIDKLLEFRSKFDKYPSDGVVVRNLTTNDRVALKFDTTEVLAEVERIEWNLSDKNKYIPVVILKEPVTLYGTKVSRVTAYNYKYIVDNRISAGSIIKVTKANEIIPTIVKVIESKESNFKSSVPLLCEKCHEGLVIVGVHVVCENASCPNLMRQILFNFINTHFYIDELGSNLINKFLDTTKINNFTDLSSFIENTDESKWEIFNNKKSLGNKKVEILKRALIWKKLNIYKLLESLNIPSVGGKNAYKYLPILDIIVDKNLYRLSNVDDGSAVFKSLVKFQNIIIEVYSNFEWFYPRKEE